MKTLKYIAAFLLITLVAACDNDDFGDIDFINSDVAPTDVSATFQVTQDNTGVVTIAPKATGAVSYQVFFGDNVSEKPTKLKIGESVKHTYAEGEYSVRVIATSLSGKTTEVKVPLTVSFKAPSNVEVTITNDEAISKKITVKVTADDATVYDVDYGDGSDVATANIGEELTHTYAEAGKYTVKVIAKGAAKATTSKSQEVEAKVLQQPTIAAPAQPTREVGDVISLFCSKYTNVENTNFNPDWGQSGQGSGFAEFDLKGDKMLQYTSVSYQGIQLAKEVDLSQMEYLHMDIWTADMPKLETSLISTSSGEKPVVSELTADGWTSIDIPLSEFTKQGLTIADIHQLKFVSANWLKETKAGGTIFIDNLYFYKKGSSSTFDDGLLTNGNFESGSNPWIKGVDDSSPVDVVTKDGNTYFSVDVASAGNPWDVNMSQKVEITEGEKYTLSFEAWSNTNRAIIAGIGLSADPWTNVTETVNITPTKTVYTLSLVATGFGATNARVIFDLGAAAGSVNIDNVSLVLGYGGATTSPVVGTWKLASEAGAFKVGPTKGSGEWWGNSADDVTTRACIFDDTYVFNADGTFKNVQGDSTWLETWQGAAADGCGTPVAPHNGTINATYTYDSEASTIVLKGKGAFLGLPKAINGGELTSPSEAPESVTYEVTLEDAKTMIVSINIGSGFWTYKLVKQ